MINKIIEFLNSAGGWAFYSELRQKDGTINQIAKLIQQHPDKPIRELLTLQKLQQQAAERLAQAQEFVFTPQGVEQSSSSELAQYHAAKLAAYKSVADLCCGNGVDLHYLAAGKQQVWAVDLDADSLAAARYNNRQFPQISFQQQRAEDFQQAVEAIFIDPDRRIGGRRLIEAEDLSPKLSEILDLQKITPNILVKLSPAMNYRKLEISLRHSWEFISEQGELKEILLCLGDFATAGKRAVLLPQGHILSATGQQVQVGGISNYLYEPDTAIIRAGLVQDLGAQISAELVDPHLALLSSAEEKYSVFCKTYRVLAQMNFNRKQLQKYLRQQQIGNLVIKTRGFSQSVEEFRRGLKLKGSNSALLFILRIGAGHQIIFAELQQKKMS
ncbi:MAG: class I SAM-dependent methyltransferase [Candidatus Cloacimonadales bacterium]